MPTLAAVDVGSNGIRLAVAAVRRKGNLRVVENAREAVRLGQDVFTRGAFTPDTIRQTTEAFARIRERIDRHGAARVRAVGTSAVREASNGRTLVRRIAAASGIRVRPIDAAEEARLVHRAVADKIDLADRRALLVDVGGGSVELTVSREGRVAGTRSLSLGTVRLLTRAGRRKSALRRLEAMAERALEAESAWIDAAFGEDGPDLCVGTGGNIESLVDLSRRLYGSGRSSMLDGRDLDRLVPTLARMTVEERIGEFLLRPDRADVILPAAVVLLRLLRRVRARRLAAPRVGLKDGLLLRMAREGAPLAPRRPAADRIVAAAFALGRKYFFDEEHARRTARFADRLFVATRSLHRLGAADRRLLELAALLHDIGHFVESEDHHKHSYYLLSAAPLPGLDPIDRAVVANVARYHRRAFPTLEHEPFSALSRERREAVQKMAGLLRVADALDTDFDGRVGRVDVRAGATGVSLKLSGEGNLGTAQWVALRKASLFEAALGVRLRVNP